MKLFLFFNLLVDDLLYEYLQESIERRGLIKLKVVEVAEFFPEAHDQCLLDDITLLNEIIDFEHSHSFLFLILLDHFCNLLEKFLELTAVDLFLQQSIKDLVHDSVGILGWGGGSAFLFGFTFFRILIWYHFVFPIFLFFLIVGRDHEKSIVGFLFVEVSLLKNFQDGSLLVVG